MPNKIDKVIKKFVKEIRTLLGNRVKQVILYGSYARGDYNKSSDIDIMILTDLTLEEIEEYREIISNIIFEIQIEDDVYISPIIKNIDSYNSKIGFVPFYMNIQKEGVNL